jgi:AAA15 family ATPase/GTPase
MIQELKIKNYLSFKDEVVFNFEASNDKFADECQVIKINDNTRLLRFAVIYGYNASGKTNLLKAFDFLRKFWSNYSDDMDEETNTIPFKLDN